VLIAIVAETRKKFLDRISEQNQKRRILAGWLPAFRAIAEKFDSKIRGLEAI
jgi:hypothetical protein